MKSFTLPPRQSVATPEILVTSHFEGDKSHLPEDKADIGDDEAIDTDDGLIKGLLLFIKKCLAPSQFYLSLV